MYNVKSNGQNIDPCGTPKVIIFAELLQLPILTNCCLPVRKLFISSNASRLMT